MESECVSLLLRRNCGDELRIAGQIDDRGKGHARAGDRRDANRSRFVDAHAELAFCIRDEPELVFGNSLLDRPSDRAAAARACRDAEGRRDEPGIHDPDVDAPPGDRPAGDSDDRQLSAIASGRGGVGGGQWGFDRCAPSVCDVRRPDHRDGCASFAVFDPHRSGSPLFHAEESANDVGIAKRSAGRDLDVAIDATRRRDEPQRRRHRLAERIVERQVADPERAVRSRHGADHRKDHPLARRQYHVFLRRHVNEAQVRGGGQRERIRVPRPELHSPDRLVEAVAAVQIRGDRLRADAVRHAVELVEALRCGPDHDLRSGLLEVGDDLGLVLARRGDRHLIEARRIAPVREEVEGRLIREIVNRLVRAGQAADLAAHRLDPLPHFLGMRIDFHVNDAALVVDQIADSPVDEVRHPQQRTDERNGSNGDQRDERADTLATGAPGAPQRANREDGQQHEHRPRQERRKVLVAELRAAECRPLHDHGEDADDHQRVIEHVGAAKDHPLDVVDGRDRDRQRRQDQVELLCDHEVRDRPQAQVRPEERHQIGERQRPDGVDDPRDRHERDVDEIPKRASGDEVGDERRRADDGASEEQQGRSQRREAVPLDAFRNDGQNDRNGERACDRVHPDLVAEEKGHRRHGPAQHHGHAVAMAYA